MLFSTSAYFSSTALRRIFRLGVTSPLLNTSSRQDLEPLDGLPTLEGLVSLRDLTLNQVMNFA